MNSSESRLVVAVIVFVCLLSGIGGFGIQEPRADSVLEPTIDRVPVAGEFLATRRATGVTTVTGFRVAAMDPEFQSQAKYPLLKHLLHGRHPAALKVVGGMFPSDRTEGGMQALPIGMVPTQFRDPRQFYGTPVVGRIPLRFGAATNSGVQHPAGLIPMFDAEGKAIGLLLVTAASAGAATLPIELVHPSGTPPAIPGLGNT